MLLIGFLIAVAFGNLERNFNPHTLTISLFSSFLNGVIYGSFFLAYYYYRSNNKHQQKLVYYNEALAESKIRQLKTQLNPHFLFNNLNVLDQLIEEDKQKASDFLNEFAEIYRYVLQSMERELIFLEEEIEFASQYFKLIQHKYSKAYQLQITNKCKHGYIVPMTLQVLLENAVKHNLGTEENPVYIHIVVDEYIFVSNNINLKRNGNPTSGRALKNLKEQYRLLSEKSIEIHQTKNDFLVTVCHTICRPFRLSNKSGVMFSVPLLPGFAASWWKAWAMIFSGSMLMVANATSTSALSSLYASIMTRIR